MGTSLGCVKFKDGTILFAAYQNTTDVMNHCLWNTIKEAMNICSDDRKECTCDKTNDVIIATNYGGGFFWSGKACKKCKIITMNQSPCLVEGLTTSIPAPEFYEDVLPDWWPNF